MTSLRRKITNHSFTLIGALAVAIALVPLISVTWYVTQKGAPAISWDFLTRPPTSADDPRSGILPAIQGTGLVVALAAAMGIPLGILSGIWLSEHGRKISFVGSIFRMMLDAMAATPSIVIGIFVFTVIVLTQHHFSALAGGVALGIMVTPIVARTTEISLNAVPDSLREAGVALGATHARTTFRVVTPAAKRGIITGSILAIARVTGETAPLLFTAAYAQTWFGGNLAKPVASLPTLINQYINQPTEQTQSQAWGAAFLLFVLVFGANVLVRAFTYRGGRKS